MALCVVANLDVANPWVEILLQWPLVTVLTLTLIVACISAGTNSAQRILATRPLVSTGKVSYGLYLWHFPVLVLLDSIVGLESWGPRLLGLVITAVLTILSYRYIEQPFLRMKQRARAVCSLTHRRRRRWASAWSPRRAGRPGRRYQTSGRCSGAGDDTSQSPAAWVPATHERRF